MKNRLLVIVLDGFGVSKKIFGNAARWAHMPTFYEFKEQGIYKELKAHGKAVGLGETDVGGSEVGHNALGGGRIFPQGRYLVESSLKNRKLFQSDVWKELIEKAKKSSLHFLGLLSDGGVHSHENHLYELMNEAARAGVKTLRIHALWDGRDVFPRSAKTYASRLETLCSELRQRGCDARAASGGGRMALTMDRYEGDWSMVARGWDLHVEGKGPRVGSLIHGIEEAYAKGFEDPDIPGYWVENAGNGIKDGDVLIWFNFRGDRSIELCQVFQSSFNRFPRNLPNIHFVGLMEYDPDQRLPKRYLVNPPQISYPLREHILSLGLSQFACSETHKYGHMTYFWNGNRSSFLDRKKEVYVCIPSDPLEHLLQRPWMKAQEITQQTIKALRSPIPFLRINFPNGDMLGHTGNFQKTISGLEAVDLCLQKIKTVCKRENVSVLLVGDHGNCETMFLGEEPSQPHTAHTLSPVPCIFWHPHKTRSFSWDPNLQDCGLGHVASTCLKVLGLPIPDFYLPSLLREE